MLNNDKIKKDEKEKTEDKQTINKENKPEEINNNPKQNEKIVNCYRKKLCKMKYRNKGGTNKRFGDNLSCFSSA